MRDGRWILTAALFVQLGFYFAPVCGRGDYEANAFLEQFRRQFRERRPSQGFESRDGNGGDYRGLTSADDADDERVDRAYGHGSPWMSSEGRSRPYRRHPEDVAQDVEYAAPSSDVIERRNDDGQPIVSSENAAILKTAVGRQLEYEPVQRSEVLDTFKVETRAQARQPPYYDRTSGQDHLVEKSSSSPASDIYFIAVVAGCSAAAIFGVMAAGFCWYKFQKNAKAAAEAEYPAYGVTGPNREHISPSSGGDRKLAQNAQMYHYQHQKQQMIAMEKNNGDRQVSTSDLDSEEENEEGDYTVYECPGLAPTGEMEVKNPLFQDDPTPASPIPGRTPLNSGTSEDSSK